MAADRALLDLLGVAGPEALVRVGHAATPAPTRAEGFVARALPELLARSELWLDVPAGAKVYRAEPEPGFVAVAEEDLVEVVSGAETRVHGLAGFDSRGARVVLRVRGDAGEPRIVDVRDGEVEVWAVADALASLPPSASTVPEVAAPDVAAWSAGAEPWLAAAAAALAASPAVVDRLAAAGLLARLWTEGDSPRERVRAWAKGLGAAALAAVETLAVGRAWDLAERIAGVGELPGAIADEAVAAMVRERDDLQSVRRVLKLAGEGDRLVEALARADRAAAVHASALADHLPHADDDPETDRWSAVAWQEPDAWWAGSP
ncbi:MAG: hypothetical protein ACOZNI_08655 [Myxococcota bacterium]